MKRLSPLLMIQQDNRRSASLLVRLHYHT